MEVHNVLADEVIQLILIAVPELVEVDSVLVAVVLCRGHVPYGRIHPDIEELVFFSRYFESEVWAVARYVPVLQAGFEPLVELVRDRFLRVSAGDEPGEPVFVIIQLEEIMFGGLRYRCRSAGGAGGIDEVGRSVSAAADLARVPILVLGFAFGARAANISVGQ